MNDYAKQTQSNPISKAKNCVRPNLKILFSNGQITFSEKIDDLSSVGKQSVRISGLMPAASAGSSQSG
jgi:hypothetical protein